MYPWSKRSFITTNGGAAPIHGAHEDIEKSVTQSRKKKKKKKKKRILERLVSIFS